MQVGVHRLPAVTIPHDDAAQTGRAGMLNGHELTFVVVVVVDVVRDPEAVVVVVRFVVDFVDVVVVVVVVVVAVVVGVVVVVLVVVVVVGIVVLEDVVA